MSIRLLLDLSVVFELPTEFIDFTLDFPQANLELDIYTKIPPGFKTPTGNNGEYVLKLQKHL